MSHHVFVYGDVLGTKVREGMLDVTVFYVVHI